MSGVGEDCSIDDVMLSQDTFIFERNGGGSGTLRSSEVDRGVEWQAGWNSDDR